MKLPLNARDTYQFLSVAARCPVAAWSAELYYGSDSAGSVSVNGGRDRANNFSVNGGDANDQFVNLPTIQPTPTRSKNFASSPTRSTQNTAATPAQSST